MTGASGCVGQYISRWLLDHSDAELLLWLRDPAKLTAVPADHPRIRLLVGDLRDTDRFAQELASVNRVIHTATAWGDPERAEQVNVVAVKRMLALLEPSKLEQIIYFSTASSWAKRSVSRRSPTKRRMRGWSAGTAVSLAGSLSQSSSSASEWSRSQREMY